MFLLPGLILGLLFPGQAGTTTVSFLPFCISNWNNLDSTIKSSTSLSLFKTTLNKFLRPNGNIFFASLGIKLLAKIRVCFNDLRNHMFNHNFNCANPTFSCGFDDETTAHLFLVCPRYSSLRTMLGKSKRDLYATMDDQVTQ